MSSAAQKRARRQALRGTEPPYHGTAYIYDYYACRCDVCSTGASAERASYSNAKRARERAAKRLAADPEAQRKEAAWEALRQRFPRQPEHARTKNGFPVLK